MTDQEIILKFKDYLTYEKNYSLNTIKSYLFDINEFRDFVISESFGDSVIVERQRIFGYFLNHLASKDLSNRTIARKLSSLRTFYNYLKTEGYILKNVVLQVKAPKQGKKLPKVLKKNEIELVYNSIDKTTLLGKRNYLIFDMLFSLGLRAEELCEL